MIAVAVVALGGGGEDERERRLERRRGSYRPEGRRRPDRCARDAGRHRRRTTGPSRSRAARGQKRHLHRRGDGSGAGPQVDLPAAARRSRSSTVRPGSPCPPLRPVVQVAARRAGTPKTIGVGSEPYGVAGDGNRSGWPSPRLSRSRRSTPAAGRSTPVPIEESAEPTELTFGEAAIWVVDRTGSQLFSLQPWQHDGAAVGRARREPEGRSRRRRLGLGREHRQSGNVVQLSPDGEELDEVEVGGEPRLARLRVRAGLGGERRRPAST